ncbi:hypothetical protein [Oceanidesulfovibrio marinus]|uniref:Uncharacterized protein n=1 Tax=Oceanidesulfovibrio marinus TaxID=370038 RepID=A0A6P1ZCI5_9BACT|nr:hypothetical protein [Oceanidesulfovibrio marinus]TVM31211.1 hypothetical protein DQK91_19060 [Oceanidesulfovibrio marinus]
MNDIQLHITIEGVTPLLCNKFTDEAQMSATNGTRSSAIGDRGTPREQAATKLYLGHDGKPMIPQPNLLRCLIDAGKFFKSGKSKITTQKSSIITSCVDILGVEIPIVHEDPWEVDTRAVRIPSTGGRITTHRPSFNDWKLNFLVTLDTTILTEKFFREIVDAAGKRIGLGDFRPDCKGPFGKFVVSHWQREENKKAA